MLCNFFSFVPEYFHILYGFLFVKWHNVKNKLHCVKSDEVCTIRFSAHEQNRCLSISDLGRNYVECISIYGTNTVYLYRKYWPRPSMIMFGVYNYQYPISNSISSQMCYSVDLSSASTSCQSISS